MMNVLLTLVLTWFIPPPFVYPSSFSFSWDVWATEMLESLLTAHHLTSVLVLSTDICSATKARALSQYLGALAAAAVSIAVLPWFGKPRAQRTRVLFREQTKLALKQDIDIKDAKQRVHESLGELLAARRDLSSVQEAQGWIPSLLQTIGLSVAEIDKDKDASPSLSQDLAIAAFGGFGSFALEALLARIQTTPLNTDVKAGLEAGNFDQALSLLGADVASDTTTDAVRSDDDLPTIYLHILVLRE